MTRTRQMRVICVRVRVIYLRPKNLHILGHSWKGVLELAANPEFCIVTFLHFFAVQEGAKWVVTKSLSLFASFQKKLQI